MIQMAMPRYDVDDRSGSSSQIDDRRADLVGDFVPDPVRGNAW
jgi:hypothetical protein